MLLSLIEVSFRTSYWVVDKTVGTLWRWYWPVETVESLAEQVALLRQQVTRLELALEKSNPDQRKNHSDQKF